MDLLKITLKAIRAILIFCIEMLLFSLVYVYEHTDCRYSRWCRMVHSYRLQFFGCIILISLVFIITDAIR